MDVVVEGRVAMQEKEYNCLLKNLIESSVLAGLLDDAVLQVSKVPRPQILP